MPVRCQKCFRITRGKSTRYFVLYYNKNEQLQLIKANVICQLYLICCLCVFILNLMVFRCHHWGITKQQVKIPSISPCMVILSLLNTPLLCKAIKSWHPLLSLSTTEQWFNSSSVGAVLTTWPMQNYNFNSQNASKQKEVK